MTVGEIFSTALKLRGANLEEKDIYSLSEISSDDLQSEAVEDFVSSLFFDKKILDEGAAVTIRNSSGEPGLGNKLAAYLNNLGASVVLIESGEERIGETTFYVKNSKL